LGFSHAHGKGMALQLNYLLDRGAFVAAQGGTFKVDQAKAPAAVAALTGEIMEIQVRGDYAAAKAMLEKHSRLRPEVLSVLKRAQALPVDIAPRHGTAEKLLRS
jgi:hypothetical protein